MAWRRRRVVGGGCGWARVSSETPMGLLTPTHNDDTLFVMNDVE